MLKNRLFPFVLCFFCAFSLFSQDAGDAEESAAGGAGADEMEAALDAPAGGSANESEEAAQSPGGLEAGAQEGAAGEAGARQNAAPQASGAPENEPPAPTANEKPPEKSEPALPPDWYVGKPVKNILFDGLDHIRQADIEGVVDPYIGKPLTDELFMELQGRLYALEYFEDISPHAQPTDKKGSGVILRFKVKERAVISKVAFSGLKGLRASDLRDVISCKSGDVYNAAKVRIDEQAITAKYIEKGFPDAQVKADVKTNSNSTVDITFLVMEGEKLTIKEIVFEGNKQFSERTLRGQLSLKQKGFLKDGAFQEAALQTDINALNQYYHDRGYIDAEVTDVVREYSVDKKKGRQVTLIFKIYEGGVYTFQGVTFEGNKVFSDKQLRELVRSKEGQIVNAQRLEADLQRVADLYYENGYIYNTINREERRNLDERTLSYLLVIVERDRAFVENIIIRGNKKTKDFVILREIPLESGDIFSKTRVLDGLRNLYNLQYFSNIVPETPSGSAEGLLDLVITVEEQPTTDIQAGMTFSGSSDPDSWPMSFLVKWTDRNFLGRGNTFGISANVSNDIQNVSIEYQQKWLFGLPLTGGFDFTFQHAKRYGALDNQPPFFFGDEDTAYPDGFDSYSDYVANDELPEDEYLFTYEQWSVSAGFSTGYRWRTPFGNLGIGGGFRLGFKNNQYDRTLYRAFDRTLRENAAWTPATSVYSSISLDDRDVFYDPSRGYYLIQRFGVYGLLPKSIEEEYYFRTDSKAEIFFTLWNWQIFESWAFKGVLGLHTGFSFIFPQAGRPLDIENVDKLYVDGMFIGRGWTDERNNYGLALWENWAEVRIPLVPGILALDMLFDAAEISEEPSKLFSVDSSEEDWTQRLCFSFGGGLRFAIPQFPFRFLFVKRFKVVDGKVQWQRGAIGGGEGTGGVDFVLSFAMSSY